MKAVIFDCFGVLASDGWLPFKARYFEDNPELNAQATLLNRAVDAGKARYDEFVRQVAEMAGLPEKVAREQIENNIPDERLFAYIRQLKQGHYIGLLSNAGDNWLNDIFTAEQVSLFDAIALSYETGFIKPDAEAYNIIAKRLQVEPLDCIFVDDQPKYVEGAEQAGMQAVLYTNADEFMQKLPALLADS
ncbi:MAG TPA: HAD-IA family hydrolase [Verrucomicrobiae bacterium]|nr:HAD-IA family hydrolase [Verrucomicrobiae bacterium]